MNTTKPGRYQQETIDLQEKFGAVVSILAVTNGNKGCGFSAVTPSPGMTRIIPKLVVHFAAGVADESYKPPQEFQDHADALAVKLEADFLIIMLGWGYKGPGSGNTGYAIAGKNIPPRNLLSALLFSVSLQIGMLQTAGPN